MAKTFNFLTLAFLNGRTLRESNSHWKTKMSILGFIQNNNQDLKNIFFILTILSMFVFWNFFFFTAHFVCFTHTYSLTPIYFHFLKLRNILKASGIFNLCCKPPKGSLKSWLVYSFTVYIFIYHRISKIEPFYMINLQFYSMN